MTGKKNKKKKEQKKLSSENSKLLEGTASKNLEKKNGNRKTAIYVKNWHLEYENELKSLQIELMKLQQHMKSTGFEPALSTLAFTPAFSAAFSKRITAFLNPRNTRVVALTMPNETEKTQWYFQRYTPHLPSAGEMVLFDRSWYNRAMVEPVMGFCTDVQNKRFLKDVPMLEELLVKDGIKLFKFYFSVSKDVQKERFDSRKEDPLKQYKLSPVDNLAQKYWNQYSVRKFQMLSETNRTMAPWTIVRSDVKKKARLNCIKHILSSMDYKDKIPLKQLQTDPEIIISGIDELRHMEKNIMNPKSLHG